MYKFVKNASHLYLVPKTTQEVAFSRQLIFIIVQNY